MLPTLAYTDLIASFRKIGLARGMGLVVHSSLKSFGHVAGGPHAVLQALMDILTPAGTLLLPTFNHGVPFEPGGAGYFDPLQTPTINGAIPDAFWRLPGVSRSLDPTHPFAAWGKNSLRYTANHHRTITMGPQSPLGLLLQDDGWCLLLGVTYLANTFHHAVEMSPAVSAPCLGVRTEAYPVRLPGGRMVTGRTWGWRGGECPFTDHGRYGAEMQRLGLERVLQVGLSQVTLYRLSDGYQVIASILKNGLDGIAGCSGCPVRPRQCEFTVPSDWDFTRQEPLPDSSAWTY